MKKMTLPVAVAVAIIGCVLAVSANVTTSKMNDNLDQERYQRMLVEKQFQKAQGTIKELQNELKASRAKIQSIEQILNQGESATADLKAQLEAVAKEKETLRQQIEALNLASGQATKP